ncbi:MAG: hypothetical protein KBS76_01985 [Ruminococcus sp.]|nr:hypothetical protein [Candidatus Apopatosoma intestinale]
MNFFQKMKKKPDFRQAMIFVLAGLILIGAGFIFFREMAGTYQKTEATIVEIVHHTEIGGDTDAEVFVDYSVGGKKHEHVHLGSYDITMKEGKTITIEYNVDRPGKIRVPSAVIVPYILWGCGIFGIVIGARNAMKSSAEDENPVPDTFGEE